MEQKEGRQYKKEEGFTYLRSLDALLFVQYRNHSFKSFEVWPLTLWIHLSIYQIIRSSYARMPASVLPSQISHNLSGSNGHNMAKEARERISEEVARIQGLISCRAELDKLPIPVSLTPSPIPVLGRPKTDGEKCPYTPCYYISYE